MSELSVCNFCILSKRIVVKPGLSLCLYLPCFSFLYGASAREFQSFVYLFQNLEVRSAGFAYKKTLPFKNSLLIGALLVTRNRV